jgi:hypothetical protein
MRETVLYGYVPSQDKEMQLIPISNDVKVLSMAQNVVGGDVEDLFPSVTEFTNKLGGKVFVFSGSPRVVFGESKIWSYLASTRKDQFIEIFRNSGNLPCYYPGDAPVYVRAGYTSDGQIFSAITNSSFDVLEDLEIGVDNAPKSVKKLCPNGELEEVKFVYENGIVKTNVTAQVYETVILLIK